MSPEHPEGDYAYTDGSSLENANPNGGPGGVGVHARINGEIKEWGIGYHKTTNNRMEIRAVIFILEQFEEPTKITVFTDSQYTIDAITKWIHGWKRNNWITGAGLPVKNKDLFEKLDALMKLHDVTLSKVKGHSGIPGNEAADKLAGDAARAPTMDDEGFIPPSQQPKPPPGYTPWWKQRKK
ncbi:Rnase H [Aeromonas phage D3]|uniref:ribonuclease H n=2 Tax=Ludhianavirus TaxID=3044751 RepID=A0A514TVV0_9CAUD|nr:Rnase H [Aeromonas phage D3]YP_010668884.1 Rnase H [Aeromonas phage D6]QDJ97134.1 ribonuclease HI [Aeromonas phage D3]QDJ97296.1 putative ribonuclease HI [Aeromonas phage D6]QEP52441.1 ribonuclease HI [Aeromonas phage D9]